MSTTVKRLMSETPPYWKKVQWLFGVIAVVLGAALPFLYNIPDVPVWVTEVVKLLTAIAAAIVGMAQFTTSDKSLSDK